MKPTFKSCLADRRELSFTHPSKEHYYLRKLEYILSYLLSTGF